MLIPCTSNLALELRIQSLYQQTTFLIAYACYMPLHQPCAVRLLRKYQVVLHTVRV
jgi:hypothetical protein